MRSQARNAQSAITKVVLSHFQVGYVALCVVWSGCHSCVVWQILGLVQGLPLEWPAAVQTLFDVQNAVAMPSERVLQLDCAFKAEAGAETSLFYSKEVR
jgi:hypothetical protein